MKLLKLAFRLQGRETFFMYWKFYLLFDKVFLCDCYFYLHKTINISCCLINRLQCREKHFTKTNQSRYNIDFFSHIFIFIWFVALHKSQAEWQKTGPWGHILPCPMGAHPWKKIIVLCVNIISGITISPTISMWESVSERNN